MSSDRELEQDNAKKRIAELEAELATAKAEVERLSAPVSDAEWEKLHDPFICYCDDTPCSCYGLVTVSQQSLSAWVSARKESQ